MVVVIHAGKDVLTDSADIFLEPVPVGNGDGCENCVRLEVSDMSSNAME